MKEMRPSPVSNADAEPYWAAANDGRLVIQRCRSCGHSYFLPSYLCPLCWSSDKEWVTAAGRGKIYSFSIIHRAPIPSFKHDVPYVVALIELEEGPRMMTNIVGEGALEAKIGDPVTVFFEDRGGRKLPQFQLAR